MASKRIELVRENMLAGGRSSGLCCEVRRRGEEGRKHSFIGCTGRSCPKRASGCGLWAWRCLLFICGRSRSHCGLARQEPPLLGVAAGGCFLSGQGRRGQVCARLLQPQQRHAVVQWTLAALSFLKSGRLAHREKIITYNVRTQRPAHRLRSWGCQQEHLLAAVSHGAYLDAAATEPRLSRSSREGHTCQVLLDLLALAPLT